MKKSFSFEIITGQDGTIRLVNPKFDEQPRDLVQSLVGGLISGVETYNEKVKERNKEGYREREMEIMRQAFASFEDDVKACVDFYYLSPVPKTAQEIREQCLFIGREEEIANTKEVLPDLIEK